MVGEYWSFYNREGRGKKKRYKCLLCNHKLPTYEGITSHISRSHGEEIEENKRKVRKEEEEQQREKKEEIARERRTDEFVKQQLRIYKERDLKIKEQKRLEEKQAKQKIIERNRKIYHKLTKAHENGEFWGNKGRITINNKHYLLKV